MTCEEARKNLPLFLYGELSFDEEELVEVHIDECAAAAGRWRARRRMFAALDGVEMVPTPRRWRNRRAELRSRLALAGQPMKASHDPFQLLGQGPRGIYHSFSLCARAGSGGRRGCDAGAGILDGARGAQLVPGKFGIRPAWWIRA